MALLWFKTFSLLPETAFGVCSRFFEFPQLRKKFFTLLTFRGSKSIETKLSDSTEKHDLGLEAALRMT